MKLHCFRISNGGLTGAALPSRIKLLNWGDNPNCNTAPIRVGEHTVRALAAAQSAHGAGVVALDYEHNTVKGALEFERTAEPRKVAGYGRPVAIPGEGLFLDMAAYTPSGMENAREYIDLSPAVAFDPESGEVNFVHSVALCRQGAVEGLHFYTIQTQETGTMEELKMQIEALQKALVAVTARVEELANATTAVKADTVEALSAQVKGLDGKIAIFTADLAAENGKRDKAALLESAARDGKVVALTAEAVAKLSLSDLQAHVATLTPSIPLSRRTPASATTLVGQGLSLIEQYNAIEDPLKRIEFFRANRSKISTL